MGAPGDYQYQGAFPTVSKEQWVKHSIKKLSKGYMLIVSKTRNVANFYKGYGDFETCSFHTAKRLIREGYLEETGEHMLGTLYQLKAEYKEEVAAPKVEKRIPQLIKRDSLFSKPDGFEDDDIDIADPDLEDEDTDAATLEEGFLSEMNDDSDDPDMMIV